MTTTQFLVRKDCLREHRLLTPPAAELLPGAVELQIDRFGFTANNVTYGVMGDSLAYWKFFPVAGAIWGILPVWGFGTVTRTTVPDVREGDRFYGYYPMASHVVVEPKKVSALGFLDGAAHRRGLSGVYNQYLSTKNDALYREESERAQVVLRPLYATAYFLADFLAHHGFFGAEDVLVSSASSKLGWATALVLREHGRGAIGLTSASNVGFVSELGLFAGAVSYDAVAALERRPAVYVDISGSAEVRGAVHRHYGDALVYSSSVGATHWDGLARGEALPGPKPIFFFTPDWIKRRTEEWGPADVQRRLAEGWQRFMARSAALVNIVEGHDAVAVAERYEAMVAGRANPRDGYVLSLRER